jgi:hypothetical protein
LKPCIDGFLNGRRPYLAIDSTFMFFLSTKHSDLMVCSCRGPPKKRAKSTHSSIVPLEDDASAASMSFPPRFAFYDFL